MSLEEAIRNSYLAQGFGKEQLEALYGIAHWETYQDGEIILRQFDETRDLFILASGRAHIITVVGEPIGVVKPGMPIGEISFLDARPRSVSVISMGPSEVVRLPFEETWNLLKEHPETELQLLRNISRVLCARLRSANNNIAALLAIEESEVAVRA